MSYKKLFNIAFCSFLTAGAASWQAAGAATCYDYSASSLSGVDHSSLMSHSMASMPYMSGAHDGGWGAAAAASKGWCPPATGMHGATGFEQLGGQLSGQLGSLIPSQSYNMAAAHASFSASVSSPSVPSSSPDKPQSQAATTTSSTSSSEGAIQNTNLSHNHIPTSTHASSHSAAAVHAAHAVASSYPSYFTQFADPSSLMSGRVH